MKQLGALFDLDGVLIDSEKCYTRFWEEIEKMYPTGIPNYPYAIKGMNLETIIKNYDSQAVRDDIVSRLMKFQNEIVYEPYDPEFRFLRELKEAGVPRALVTSSDNRKMEALFGQLPQLKELFDYVIDGSMVERSKPDPQGYNIAAAHIGVEPEYCCVFEDSIQGLKAGRAAGGKLVGVATTYARDVVGPMCDMVIDSIAQMSLDRFLNLWD